MKTIRLDGVRVCWEEEEDGLWCQAIAIVSYPTGNGVRRLEWLSSAGLGGIDPASDDAYRSEVEAEQRNDLREHLQAFGVSVKRWPELLHLLHT